MYLLTKMDAHVRDSEQNAPIHRTPGVGNPIGRILFLVFIGLLWTGI